MQNELSKPWFESNKEKLILGVFILLKLIICAWPYEYGYFFDELYYIALSHHLDWGYVDVPPLLPFCIFLLRYAIGNSLFALHLFTATTGALVLIIAWMIVKKMEGKLFSQIMVLTCVALAPFYIVIESACIKDTLNELFWALALYFIVNLLVTENKKYWIYFGIAAGLGLMSKFDILWLGAGIAVGMILTLQRKYFVTWQLWLGGLIALLIVTPYLIWIVNHDFLTLEYFSAYGSNLISTTVWEFVKTQIAWMNPLSFPVWAIGIYYFLFNKDGRKFRMLGITYLVLIALCRILNNKFYVILPFYIVLLAGGTIYIESFLHKKRTYKSFCGIYIFLITAFGLFLVPYMRPVLPPNILPEYAKFVSSFIMNFHTNKSWSYTDIPQYLLDRFGWEEMAAEFGKICNSLSLEERKNAIIVVGKYGQASAVDFYRGKYNLPSVICGHLQYYLWMPKDLSEKTIVISLEKDISGPKKALKDVKQVGKIDDEYIKLGGFSRGENIICLSKSWKVPPKGVLQSLKHMD